MLVKIMIQIKCIHPRENVVIKIITAGILVY